MSSPLTPYSGRAALSHGEHGLTIDVPPRRAIAIGLFVSAWLVGWFFGETSAIKSLAKGFQPFLIAWLTMWTIGGGVAAATVFWNFFGWQRIVLKEGTLILRWQILGVGRERRFELAHVTNLRVLENLPNRRSFMNVGTLAFDYGSKTIRFADLDPAEGRNLLPVVQSEIQKQLPSPPLR